MNRPISALAIAATLGLHQGIAAEPPSGGALNAGIAEKIRSDEELKSIVLQLGDPTTEMAALRRLIKFSGPFLYEGSVHFVTDDQAADELRRAAARAVGSHGNLDSVRRALDDDDREVRFWGVMSFGFTHGETKPWEPLLPRLEEIASRDADAGIRAQAIEKLWYHEAAAAFLTSLQNSTNETNPDVLMTLLQFGTQQPERRTRWYARAVQILSGKDEALRLEWLTYIWGNAWNPSTAPMWRIEADPALVESLRQIERIGSQKEQELASKALLALATSAQPDGAANRSQPIRSETNSTSGAAGSGR
jgi:hypothetical protein